jgi:creatinine amidohydrolase
VWAPALPYGSSGEHSGFPGTLSLGQAASEAAVIELVRSADRFEGIALLSRRGSQQPIARPVRPEEVAEAIAWLADPATDAITGATVPADGGLSL